MFAALAASGFVGSTSKPAADDSSKAAAKPTDPGAESSAAAAPAAIQRRRSQRLSAKQAGSSSGEPATEMNGDSSLLMDASTSTAVANSDASSTLEAVLAPVDPALGNNVIDSGFAADFTDEEDDEVDAEVFDDEVDPDTSLSEKTVTVSVVEGLINYPLSSFVVNIFVLRWYEN
jgi:E3 ubiquitin-protein ligase TRIP12